MIRGLVEKELRQHALKLLFLLLLVVGGFEILCLKKYQAMIETPFVALSYILVVIVPLACLVLGYALIVSEYRNKTQLFLEGLPLPRWGMIAIKYGLGLSVMLMTLAVVFAIAWHRSLVTQAPTPRFLILIALRSACYVWLMWSLCFAHGFMGRYRLLFGIIASFHMGIITINDLRSSWMDPFVLVNHSFAYERYLVPGTQLAVAGACALFLTAAGFMLGLARDATISAALAQKMSSREKSVLIFSFFAAVFVWGSVQDKITPPVLIPGAVEATRGRVQVAASAAVDVPTEEENAALASVAQSVADELAAVADFLRCEHMPHVFIIHRRDLKPGSLEDVAIKKEQGVMVRVNLTAKEFKMDDLLRRIISNELGARSFGRLKLERNAWVLDGFSSWWLSRRVLLGQDQGELGRAIKAMPENFSARHLDRWLSLHKTVGDNNAGALASTGLRVLTSQHGDEACQSFLISVLGVEIKKDARAWVRDVFHPVSSRFRTATGMGLEAFIGEWRDALCECRGTLPKGGKP